jgi:cobalt/nickel transport protein
MSFKYGLEVVTVIAIAIFCLIFFYTGSTMKNAEFRGTDTIAAEKMSELSGNSPAPVIQLIPQWVPPSPEIESTLFALQAAIGGILVGGVFGYWIGQKKKEETE